MTSLIVKRGYWYREDWSGYTSDILQAGLYSDADADAHCTRDADLSAVRVSEVQQHALTSIDDAERNIARWRDALVNPEREAPRRDT